MHAVTKMTDEEMVILLHDIARNNSSTKLRMVADRLAELSKQSKLDKE